MVDSSSSSSSTSSSFIPKPPRYYNSTWKLLSQGAEARVWLIPDFLSFSTSSASASASAYKKAKTTPAICKERFAKSYRHPTLNDTLTKARTKAEARSLCRCRRGGVSVPVVLGVDIPFVNNKNNNNGNSETAAGNNKNDEVPPASEYKIESSGNENEGTSACLFLEKIEGCTTRSFFNDTSKQEGEEHVKKKIKLDNEEEEDTKSKKSILTRLDDDAKKVAYAIGVAIGKMHNANIVHGDLTTSNILLRNPPSTTSSTSSWEPDIVIIDFGLSSTSTSASSKKKQSLSASCHEERAVDLYVLERAFITTHVGGDVLVEEILRAYKKACVSSDSVLQRLSHVRLRGRKRECFG